jgi:membrane protein YqaA with SNARE-associated domain
MGLTEAYALLFMDSIVAAIALPLRGRLIFDVMHTMGGYQSALVVTLATLGSALGAVVNWGIGRLLMCCPRPGDASAKTQQAFTIIDNMGANRFTVLLGLLAPIPWIGGWATIVCGLVNIPLGRYLPAALVGYFCFFTWIFSTAAVH